MQMLLLWTRTKPGCRMWDREHPYGSAVTCIVCQGAAWIPLIEAVQRRLGPWFWCLLHAEKQFISGVVPGIKVFLLMVKIVFSRWVIASVGDEVEGHRSTSGSDLSDIKACESLISEKKHTLVFQLCSKNGSGIELNQCYWFIIMHFASKNPSRFDVTRLRSAQSKVFPCS